MLKRFQASSSTHEQQVYACMVHNLFDEYRYFPKYPDKPLRTTALLFGALVAHGLVSHKLLGMFLRYVLEALRKPPTSKMCKFGLTALDQFKSRLPEWRQYCGHLYGVPHLAAVAPELIPFLENVIHGRPIADASPPAPPAPQPPSIPPPAGLESLKPPAAAPPAVGGPPGLYANPSPVDEPTVTVDSQADGASVAAVGGAGVGSGGPSGLISLPSSLPTVAQLYAPGLKPSVSSDQLPHSQSAPPSSAPIPSSLSALRSSPQMQPTTPLANTPKASAPTAGAFGPASATSELPAAAMADAFAGSGFGTQPCIETLISAASNAEVVPPPESVQDKIGFVLNNMTMANVASKSHELQAIIEGNHGYIVWFAQYLVVKRVSLEPNFHSLYSGMLDELQMKPLHRAILSSTLQNARVLLSSAKIRSSSSQRSLLKNLGSWLGQITLARNKALLMRSLDMKELICDAYERGLLIAVVPFVAKVLDACSHSRVFMPPNPWVMALMSLLLELYQASTQRAPPHSLPISSLSSPPGPVPQPRSVAPSLLRVGWLQVPDLKLNLKFEIEVLAKTLKVELADIKPANKLATRQQAQTPFCHRLRS